MTVFMGIMGVLFNEWMGLVRSDICVMLRRCLGRPSGENSKHEINAQQLVICELMI